MKKIITICVLLFATTNVFADEPNSIGEIFTAKGVEWLLGTWETTTDRGDKAEATFSLDMDGYILKVEANVGQLKNHGMYYYIPTKKMIVFNGADNKGGTMTGTCEIENGKFVMNLAIMTSEGNITKFDRNVSKVDSDTMKSETFVYAEGKRPVEPTGVLEFKRKK